MVPLLRLHCLSSELFYYRYLTGVVSAIDTVLQCISRLSWGRRKATCIETFINSSLIHGWRVSDNKRLSRRNLTVNRWCIKSVLLAPEHWDVDGQELWGCHEALPVTLETKTPGWCYRGCCNRVDKKSIPFPASKWPELVIVHFPD